MPRHLWQRYSWAIASGFFAIHLCWAADAQVRDRAGAVKAFARQRAMTPLPPRRPADLKPLPAPAAETAPAPESVKPAGPSACFADFTERGGIALPAVPDMGNGACAVEDPVTFRSVAMPDGSRVEFDSAITVRCGFGLAIVAWVRDDLPPIMTRENAKLARLIGVGGHACRSRNGTAGAPISEHATGNALDLSGLRLQDGRNVDLTGRDAATRALRDALQKTACARFTTVLGPGSDSSHKDHLHLDMRKRPRDFKMCQWTVE